MVRKIEYEGTVLEAAEPRLTLRPKDVAALLSISSSTLWRLVKRGQLDTIKFPNVRRTCITAASVDRLLSGGGK